MEYNSKFQAISAANEILTDPGLRAKYDAQRLKEGPIKSFTDPLGRPNVPPRARPTHFPPPPRPPPHSAYKSTFTPPPTAAGARKHDKVPPRPTSTWGNIDPEEVKSKTNDFKAWEQMRHGQGPIPKHRPPPPPRAGKTTGFDPDHSSPPRKAPDGLSSKARKRWEDLLDAGRQAYTGGRPPKKSGHGHGSPEEDELSARPPAHSARKTGDMPPPPPRPGKIPDTVPGPVKDAFPAAGPRVRIAQPTSGTERTKPASPGLQRATTSATPRDHKPRPAWSNLDSIHLNGDHIRATSAGAAHREEAFRRAGISSSTTSATTSSGSSDEGEAAFILGNAQSERKRRIPKSRKPRMPAGAGIPLKSAFSPFVNVSKDEGQAPHPGYSDLRRHSGIDLPTQAMFGDHSAGLNPPQMGFGPNSPGFHRPSLSTHSSSGDRFPQRHKSFDGRYQSPPVETSRAPPNGDANGSTFDASGYSPLSFLHYSGPLPSERWSNIWPFGPLKQTNPSSYVEKPPLWAVPSTLPPVRKNGAGLPAHARFSKPLHSNISLSTQADAHFDSFRFTPNNAKSAHPPPPLRSQSSEIVTSKFATMAAASPPKFGNANPFSAQKSPRHDSDSTAVPSDHPIQSDEDKRPSAADLPPPPKVGDKWSTEDWEKRFGPHTFEVPRNNVSGRPSNNKRSGTSRSSSSNNLKRGGTFRGNGLQPTVIDDEDSAASEESLAQKISSSSKTRPSNVSNGSAMDIDTSSPAPEQGPQLAESEISPTTKAQHPPLAPSPLGHTNIKPPPIHEPGDSRLNFGDFRHVAPFSSQEGLNGVDDLKSALPFESRPSPTQPDFAKCFETLELPNPPKPPSPPGELNDSSFGHYMSAMNHYMFNWNSFSTKILMLFQRRQEEHREIGQGWIGRVGGDVDAYLHALDEDERGRQWWDTASERHRKAMQNLKSVREKMLKSKGVL